MAYTDILRNIEARTKGTRPKQFTKQGLGGPAAVEAAANRAGSWGTLSSGLAAKQEQARRAAASGAQAGKRSQLASLKEKLSSMDWTRKRAEDGGWNFFDPGGKPTSASEFASNKGLNLSTVLGGSQNPDDQQFLEEFSAAKSVLGTATRNAAEAGDGNPFLIKSVFDEEKGENVDVADYIDYRKDLLLPLMEKYRHVWSFHGPKEQAIRRQLGM